MEPIAACRILSVYTKYRRERTGAFGHERPPYGVSSKNIMPSYLFTPYIGIHWADTKYDVQNAAFVYAIWLFLDLAGLL